MSVDQKKIASYYRKYPTVKAILDLLAPPESKNNRKVTYIDNIEAKLEKRGVQTSRAEITAIFRLLDYAGCGTCIRGISGRRTRMEWAVNHTSLAGFAKEETKVAKKPKKAEKTPADPVVEDVTPKPIEPSKQGSLRNLDLIRAGMTHAEVVALLGCEGGMSRWQPKEPGHKTYAWDDERNRWVYFVSFDQNSVVTRVSMASVD